MIEHTLACYVIAFFMSRAHDRSSHFSRKFCSFVLIRQTKKRPLCHCFKVNALMLLTNYPMRLQVPDCKRNAKNFSLARYIQSGLAWLPPNADLSSGVFVLGWTPRIGPEHRIVTTCTIISSMI